MLEVICLRIVRCNDNRLDEFVRCRTQSIGR